MKQLAILLLLCSSLNAQIIGVNGTNSPETLTPEVRGYIVELTVDTFGFVFRDDKYEGGVAPQFELDNVVALSNELQAQGKTLAVCFTVYAKEINVANAMADLDYFINNGVDIYSVRIGNESWAKAGGNNGDFNIYWGKVNQYLPELLERNINRILIPVARPLDKPDWNALAAEKINSSPVFQPDYHPYWGGNQAPIIDTLGTDETLPFANLSNYAPFQDYFYQTLYNQVLSYDLIGEIREWHEANIPTKEWHITEFGPPTAVGHISNALGFDATTDWFFNHVRASDVKFVARFNGPSPTGTAIISPRSKKDVSGSLYVKRLSYYTMYNVMRNKGALINPVLTSGTYVVSVQNMERMDKLPTDYFTLQNCYIESISYTCLTGQNYYSGSGAIEWWDKASPKTYDISGFKTFDYIPSLSYGYITVTVIPFKEGCMDSNYLEYDPSANLNTGCNTLKVYGSLDKNCQNYNPNSNVIEDCIPIEVTICYKERLIFKSLGCKVDKTCKINNCK